MSDERLQDPEDIPGEDELDRSLRPKSLDAFIGQPAVKEKLAIFLQAAKGRGEALDHVLLAGPPGLGKTSLAAILAAEMGVGFHPTSGPVLEKKGDLAAVLTQLDDGDILFIDEIHRLSRAIEETLYPAMEDFQLDVMLGQGPSARSLRLDLPKFTLVGATTRTGLLASPLRDRFGVVERLDYYKPEERAAIIIRSAGLLNVAVDETGAGMLASRSRGTPRIANRLLRRVRDVVEVRGHPGIDAAIADEALTLLEVDEVGLDELDRKILRFLCETFEGRPVGLGTLADAVGESADTIEDVYEPYLLQEGLIQRTPRGRIGTSRAFRHLGLPQAGGGAQPGLF